MELSLYVLIFFIAMTYSFVGHGGASGYLAVLALFGFAPDKIAPSALLLNLLVSAIALCSYYRLGYFNWRIFGSFAFASVPASFIGGMLTVPVYIYKYLFSTVLFFAAFRMALIGIKNKHENQSINSLSPAIALPVGGGIGLLSGIIGIGGGIFLSPLLILMRWANAKTTAGVSAAFILINSFAGLLGHTLHKGIDIINIYPMVFAAFLGALTGSSIGAHLAGHVTLRRVLAGVLCIAGLKMLL